VVPGGAIAYWGLSDWWLSAFNDEERHIIRSVYRPMGLEHQRIDTGEIALSSGDQLKFLTGLLGWLNKEPTRFIAYKIADQMSDIATVNMPILSQHFAEQAKCELFYRWRNIDEFALDRAVEMCERSIVISLACANAFKSNRAFGFLPSHHCFQQYAIIEEKRGNTEKAIAIAEMARSQGWQGDWEKRIKRMTTKQAKQLSSP